MAPVLQCPDCGTKHPLGQVQDSAAFPCDGCGRMLKVPTELRARRASDATQAMPRVPGSGAAPSAAAAAAAASPTPVPPAPAPPTPTTFAPPPPSSTVSRWARLGLWLLAVPLGFFIVFGVARTLGVFTSTQLQDVFLAS